MQLRKVIFLTYYGSWPAYASYFFESCKRNSSYTFIVFTDQRGSGEEQNIRFVSSTLQEFNRTASAALGIPISLERPFKVCDLRPAYGEIYREWITGFDFWGFCDLDIMLGNLDDYLTDDYLNRLDVYSSKPLWNSGSFSLYRNSPAVNQLFRATTDWQTVFLTKAYLGFDECLQRWDGKPISIAKQTSEVLSIYDLIHAVPGIRAVYDDCVVEWPKDITKLRWSKGTWLNQTTNKEFLYFHLLLMKNSWRFYQPRLDFTKDIFVTRLGLSNHDHTKFSLPAVSWWMRRAISCAFGISASLNLKLRKQLGR